MVVDDSVTVRKVTSRLLERQGMDVMLAKDGVEAVAMLQDGVRTSCCSTSKCHAWTVSKWRARFVTTTDCPVCRS
jgi:chemosensory pili system protein ChpA (sensor histidine kinase/response regulator)